MLDIQIEPADGYTVCRPVGELDTHNVRLLRQVLGELASRPNLVIDISKVPNVDCSGLGVLIAGIRKARELGSHVAVSCTQDALALMTVSGCARIVTVSENFKDAVASLVGRQVGSPEP